MTIYIPFIFSSQIEFDLKSINQKFLLFLKLLKKHSIQYLTIQEGAQSSKFKPKFKSDRNTTRNIAFCSLLHK